MQQHLMQMQPMMASYYPNNVTSDHVQQYLDENKSLILKIVESQNSGKLSECAESQAKLQKNLMYLAAIADSQPQQPTMHTQYPSGGIAQAGAAGHYTQQQHQAQAMTSQSLMAARSSLFYAQQLPFSVMQHQQAAAAALNGHLSMSSGGTGGSSGLGILHTETSHLSGSVGGFLDFGRGEGGLTGGTGGEGDGGESLYLKSADDGN